MVRKFAASSYWVIPENIHTIPRAASWNSEGEGEFLGLEFQRHGGGGGGFNSEFSEFPEGKMAKASLKITDLLTFLVCKSSTNEPQKQEAEVSVHTDGLCSKVHIEEALKLMN